MNERSSLQLYIGLVRQRTTGMADVCIATQGCVHMWTLLRMGVNGPIRVSRWAEDPLGTQPPSHRQRDRACRREYYGIILTRHCRIISAILSARDDVAPPHHEQPIAPWRFQALISATSNPRVACYAAGRDLGADRASAATSPDHDMNGCITRVANDRQVGTIAGEDGIEYMFDLRSLFGITAGMLHVGAPVKFLADMAMRQAAFVRATGAAIETV